jgi:hypothetical protein
MPTDRETQLRRLEALELLKADMQRRLEDKIAAGRAIRVKLGTAVCSEAPDDFIRKREADELAKLRESGETREIVIDYEDSDYRGAPIEPLAVIATGVPRHESFGFRGGDPSMKQNWDPA